MSVIDVKVPDIGDFKVGQGSAVGLADSNLDIRLYFDLGAGVYGNRATRPVPLRCCWRAGASIILSHWDTDHWAGETSDAQAQTKRWIAPRQTIGPTHTAFAQRILHAGGKLHIWGPSPTFLSLAAGGQRLQLFRCKGTTRNGSGIAGFVTNPALGREWLLTGDAGYHELRTVPPTPMAIVVPHHGADMGVSSTPPGRPSGYARLLYSFGPGNSYGHPTAAAVNAHAAQHWRHGRWSASAPGHVVAGNDVLATASHAATHLDGMVVSWSTAPMVPLHGLTCTTAGSCGIASGSGCTGTPRQA